MRKERGDLRCLFGAESEFFGHTEILGMSAEGASHFDYVLIPHSHLHMRNTVMAEYPEITEAREMIASMLREKCPTLSEDTVKIMVGNLREAHLMKYVPELKTNIGEFTVCAALENFHKLVDNKEFIKICGTVPTSIAHPFLLCGISPPNRNDYGGQSYHQIILVKKITIKNWRLL